jgi:hypothetical protein
MYRFATDDLAVLRRQLCQGLAQEFAATLLLQGGLGSVRGIGHCGCNPLVQFRIEPRAPRRQRLIAGDRKKPGRNRCAALERRGPTPDVEKHPQARPTVRAN